MLRVICLVGSMLAVGPAIGAEADRLAAGLLFHASFDASGDADFARGDTQMYTAKSLAREDVRRGLDSDSVTLDPEKGRFGGSLVFHKKTEEVVFYRGGKNVPATDAELEGTISFWMQLSPDEDLPPGYVDPLQITDKAWNDACIFVDFTEANPRQFRLGIFSDYAFWNPTDRKWDDIPEDERPMVSVAEPPFSKDRWTHVAITFERFNSDGGEGDAILYLDGKTQGHVRGRQRFTWDREKVAILLGIYYVGRLDDLAIFNRALSEPEVQQLMSLPRGVKSLY